jgi:hypothetical protein
MSQSTEATSSHLQLMIAMLISPESARRYSVLGRVQPSQDYWYLSRQFSFRISLSFPGILRTTEFSTNSLDGLFFLLSIK